VTSTDRRLFEANRGLPYQEATSSTNHKKEGLTHVANNEKRGLTSGRLIEETSREGIQKKILDKISASATMWAFTLMATGGLK
jgi:hypothetical protein